MEITEKPVTIMLWGPPNSGKSWLIGAFAHTMLNINRELEKNGHKFQLQMLDTTGNDLARDVDRLSPTQYPRNNRFIFTREYRDDAKTLFDSVNVFRHNLQLYDTRGHYIFPPLGESLDSDTEKHRDVALYWVKNSTCIMLILDPGALSKEIYLEHLKLLRSHLHNRRKYIVACVTKGDKEGLFSDPVSAILWRFGKKVGQSVIDLLRGLNGDGHHVEVNVVSSVGYYLTEEGDYKPNVDGDKLINEYKWSPVRVDKPFLWLLDHVEKQRIDTSSHLIKSLLLKPFYIPYSQILREISVIREPDGHPFFPDVVTRTPESDKHHRHILYEKMKRHFSGEDLKEITFCLCVDDLPGETLRVKMMELIQHCERRFIMDKLLYCLKHHRPEVDWGADYQY